MTTDKYMKRGVSSQKEDVHKAIKNIDKGLFPQAFCKIVPEPTSFKTQQNLILDSVTYLPS